jgi:hypothetical protein
MDRDSNIIDQECFSYGIIRPEVQFLPNPSSRSSHRLLTPSMYGNDEEAQSTTLSHHYEDPARLAQRVLTGDSTGPRKKTNDLYEPISAMPLQSLNKVKHRVRSVSRSSDDSATGYTYHGREPICHRIILYLVLLLSSTATVLVVLMILGLVGPGCHCGGKTSNAKGKKTTRLRSSTLIYFPLQMLLIAGKTVGLLYTSSPLNNI